MNTQESSQPPVKKSYLVDRLGLYIGLIAVLILVSFIIFSLPFENTYIRESGVSDYYVRFSL